MLLLKNQAVSQLSYLSHFPFAGFGSMIDPLETSIECRRKHQTKFSKRMVTQVYFVLLRFSDFVVTAKRLDWIPKLLGRG